MGTYINEKNIYLCMKYQTVQKNTVKRGSRDYVEIHGANIRYTNIINNLKEFSYSNLSKDNQRILAEFLEDMHKGKYTSLHAKKGGRSYKRLVKLFYCLRTFISFCNHPNILSITEAELHKIFDDLNADIIRKKDGTPYKDKRDFKKDFATLWHWHQVKTFKVKGEKINDITEYINTPQASKPDFCYFTLDDLKERIIQLTNNEDLKTLLMVLFDTGARPSEFWNVRLKDIKRDQSDKLKLQIPDETSKTYGRTIVLMLSSNTLRRYLERHDFQTDDLIFIQKKHHMEKFLQRIRSHEEIIQLIKHGESGKIRMYDFRHSSACYYINVYKSAKDMKYRYGWKKESEIEYYTEFLGVQDKVEEADLLRPEDKLRLEEENTELKNELEKMKIQQANSMKQLLNLLKETVMSNNPEIDAQTMSKNKPVLRRIVDMEKELA